MNPAPLFKITNFFMNTNRIFFIHDVDFEDIDYPIRGAG